MNGETAARVATALTGHPADSRADAWAPAVTAGRSMTGLRAALNAGRNLAAIHESLAADAGRRLTYVVNTESRAMTRQGPGPAGGHDDYHAVDDTGLFQLFAHDVQSAVDLAVVAHRIAELALTPGLVARDTGPTVQSVRLPDADLCHAYLGDPSDVIESPTPAQRLVYGERRRRVPELFDLDYPAMLGAVQRPADYAQGVAAQRPFYCEHVADLSDQAFHEFAKLTGRTYARVGGAWLDDAEYMLVAQGALGPLAEAVCDLLRATRRLRIGVLNITMFRPFPSDVIARVLAGCKGVTVLERVDQPLAADPPLLRELRATMVKALENGRARKSPPHPGIAGCRASDMPEFFSGCYGLGGQPVQAASLVAAVDNMTARLSGRRFFYLGVDFVRPGTRFPKQHIWQDQLLDAYPQVGDLTLDQGPAPDLLPPEAVAVRILGLDSPDAMATAIRAAAAMAEAFDLNLQAHPRTLATAGPARLALDVCLAPDVIRVEPSLPHLTIVLAPGDAFGVPPAAVDDLVEGGSLILEALDSPEETWRRLPTRVRRAVIESRLHVFATDVSAIRDDLRVLAFAGAIARVSGLADRAGLAGDALMTKVRASLGAETEPGLIDSHVDAIRLGWLAPVELQPGAWTAVVEEAPPSTLPIMPAVLRARKVTPGPAHGGRFWEQVGVLSALGQDGLADPFAAVGAIPAATSALRDMTGVRTQVPQFIANRCTGCGECWVQCPDTAIPGVASEVADVIGAALRMVEADRSCDRLRQIIKPLASEVRKLIKAGPFTTLSAATEIAYGTVVAKLDLDSERREALDEECGALLAALTGFPAARTERFFDAHERQAKGTGGLLSVTIDPGACRGCSICIEACVDGALQPVQQTAEVVDTLRRNWAVWQHLPETDDRYLEGGAAAVGSLLLKQSTYRSMIGGEDVTAGAAEKAALHLVLSSVNAFVLPRVRQHVERLTALIDGLDRAARELLASDAHLDAPGGLRATPDGGLTVPLDGAKHQRVEWLATIIRELIDLRWRYTEGPGGKGRATCGMTNDATSAWGRTYPFNPYPFPWTSHLQHDTTSVAVGVFEGQMQKMARGFAWVRRAELELAGEYDASEHESELPCLGWRQFTDAEFALCPPVLAVVNGPFALDIGFEHLSRWLSSDIPVRIVVFGTPVPMPAGHTQAFDRDLASLAIAHRQAFVLQSSPATPSHLIAGVMRGLAARGPALFSLASSTASAHAGHGATMARAVGFALESRAVPALIYDPSAGLSPSERLSLDGNPMADQTWPTYDLSWVDEDGASQVMTLPVTVADWAAAEPVYRPHFTPPPDAVDAATLVRFDEYLLASGAERAGKTPFLYVIEPEGRLGRRLVSDRIVELAERRLQVWRDLRQLAGHDLPAAIQARVTAPVSADFERRMRELELRHRARIADVERQYPALIARRLVEGLVRAAGDGTETVGELLRRAATMPGVVPIPLSADSNGHGDMWASASPTIVLPTPAAGTMAHDAALPATDAPVPPPAGDEADEDVTLEPYIKSELCTSCDECININKRMFAYNKQKQAYIKDPTAGTFRQLTLAAEKCPVAIIHPGTPQNPDEPDLAKWVAQAARFQ